MYNRYIPTENTQKDAPEVEHRQQHAESERPCETAAPPHAPQQPDGLGGLLRHFLDQFHLQQVDSGDLLLLALLFFLFREDADEELLVSLGLLLIL